MLPTTLDIESIGKKVWLTSDLHFGHETVWEGCDRPGKNVDKMDALLLRNMREKVGEKDVLIVAGDLTLFGENKQRFVERMIEQMPGTKILVYGNHDRFKPRWYLNRGFVLAATSLVLPGGVLVTHDPVDATVWPHDRPVLCGHVHRLFRKIENVVNVGVDVWNYEPVLLEDALELAGDEPREPRDWGMVSKNRHGESR